MKTPNGDRETRKELTKEDIYNKISKSWDFESLMEPYRDGGTEDNKVRRTWGITIDWLHKKKGYNIEIIGQAILVVMQRVKRSGPFKGDGTYGSAGRQFVEALRSTCDALMRGQLKQDIYKSMALMRSDAMRVFFKGFLFESLPWWVKLFSWKYWRFRKERKSVAS